MQKFVKMTVREKLSEKGQVDRKFINLKKKKKKNRGYSDPVLRLYTCTI